MRKARRGHDAAPMPVPHGEMEKSAKGRECAMETTWWDDPAHDQRGPPLRHVYGRRRRGQT